jgi:DNA polymerase I-like protein with 3'-5' exonuclease and polymerase domains
MMKLAGVNMFNWIESQNLLGTVKIVSFIHDEMCVECPKSMAEDVADACQRSMESAAAVFVKTMPVPAQPNITDFWQK